MTFNWNSSNAPVMSVPLTVGFVGFDERAVAILQGLSHTSNDRDSPFYQVECVATVRPNDYNKWADRAGKDLKEDHVKFQMRTNYDIDTLDMEVLKRSKLIILLSRPDWIRRLLDLPQAPGALRGKFVVSLVTEVTIDEMYKAVHQPLQGQPAADTYCYFIRADLNIPASATAIARPNDRKVGS